jgi:hypothetical protein
MLESLLVSGVDAPAYHRCFFCQAHLAAGQTYIQHMRHHLAEYKNLKPGAPLAAAVTSAADSPADMSPPPRGVHVAGGRVRRFRKRRLKPLPVKAVKKEVNEEDGESAAHALSVSEDDCLGDSELSDSDSDSCQQQTEKVSLGASQLLNYKQCVPHPDPYVFCHSGSFQQQVKKV